MEFLLKFLDFYSMTNMTFQKYYIISYYFEKKIRITLFNYPDS